MGNGGISRLSAIQTRRCDFCEDRQIGIHPEEEVVSTFLVKLSCSLHLNGQPSICGVILIAILIADTKT